MTIREYKQEDREAVEQCIFEFQKEEYQRLPHYWEPPEKATKPYVDYLIKNLEKDSGKLFVAEMDGKVVGIVAVSIDEEKSPCVALKKHGYISDIAVLKEYRGRGIGKELLKRAEEFTKESGFEFIHLDVTIDNPAVDFYHSQGWTDQGIRMEKKLKSND